MRTEHRRVLSDHLTTFLLRTRDIFKQLLYLKHNATKEEYESTLEKQKIRASSTVEVGVLLFFPLIAYSNALI